MIYLIHGNDTQKSVKKLRELLEFFRKKISGLAFFKVEADDFSQADFEEFLRGQILFEKKHIIQCNRVLESPVVRDFIKENIKRIAESQNMFLFFETEVNKDILKLFEKHAKKIQEFKHLEARPLSGKKNDKWDPFQLTDAFGAKNRKQVWLLYQQALADGVPAEEVFWKLVWQVKNMLLLKQLDDPKESGFHPFVIKKTAGFSKNFSLDELKNLSSNLVNLCHKARRGKAEFETGVERLILSF